jgi:hypothetical protein
MLDSGPVFEAVGMLKEAQVAEMAGYHHFQIKTALYPHHTELMIMQNNIHRLLYNQKICVCLLS